MNLQVEYQRRHGDYSHIPLCHNGVCFFDLEEKPSIVAMTSLTCRPVSTCPKCETSGGFVVELFVPGYAGSPQMMGHYHYPDYCDNLLSIMKKLGYGAYTPFYASEPRDLELWLWKFCTGNSKMWGLKSVETNPKLKILEQIVHSVQKHPKLYTAYVAAHDLFLPQRKYLLFGEKNG
jgi:hypothetical protein